MKHTSIRAAVIVGTMWVNIPVLMLIVTPMLLALYLVPSAPQPPITISELVTVIALALSGFFVAWLWWSLMIPQWRLWAWRRVEDLDGLRERAVVAGLIWPAGSFFERTEFRPKALKDELQALENNAHNRT